ncbi:excisionase [Paenibacillus validus]|nr:excisionase [Paenibacillus validus]MED4606079.1 excisionase [Paenibacillus validus]
MNETNTAVPEQETLDVGEAAEYLRVSKWIIYDMVRCKQIPFFRVRTRIFFKRRELDQWCAQQGARNSSTSK